MTQEEEEDTGPGGRAQPPPVASSHRDAWAAAQHQSLGQPRENLKVEGGGGPAGGTERSLGVPLQPAPIQVGHLYLGGWAEWRVGLPSGQGAYRSNFNKSQGLHLLSLGLSVIRPIQPEKWPLGTCVLRAEFHVDPGGIRGAPTLS